MNQKREDLFKEIENLLKPVLSVIAETEKTLTEKIKELRVKGMSDHDFAKYIRDLVVMGAVSSTAFRFVHWKIRDSYEIVAWTFLEAHKTIGWEVRQRISVYSIDLLIKKLDTEISYAKKYGNSEQAKKIEKVLEQLKKASAGIMNASATRKNNNNNNNNKGFPLGKTLEDDSDRETTAEKISKEEAPSEEEQVPA